MIKYNINKLKELAPCNDLIVFTGVIGSGKGFQSDLLIDKGYTKVDFADALRQECYDMLDLPYLDPETYEKFKKESIILTDKVIGYFLEFGFPEDSNGITLNPASITGRIFLQHLGETRRKENPNYWVDKWKIKVDEILTGGGKVTCSDARYCNEISASSTCVKPCILVFCNFVSKRYDASNTHISEEMAQFLLSLDLKDLQILNYNILVKLFNRYVREVK
jgi:hypothetical protein